MGDIFKKLPTASVFLKNPGHQNVFRYPRWPAILSRFSVGIFLTMTACTPAKITSLPTLPEPLRPPIATSENAEISTTLPEENLTVSTPEPPHTIFKPTPPALPRKSVSAPLGEKEIIPGFATQSPISINVEGLPLSAFINEIFGNLLGLTFEISPDIQRKSDLITLRVNEPQTPAQLYRLAIQVLINYQVAVEWQGELLRFIKATKQASNSPSMIVEGFTSPEVPASHRPIIQFIPLKVVRNVHVRNWIQQAFKGHDLKIQEDAERNAIILIGPPQLVSQAAEAISVLDQALMRGQHSVRIEPAFLSAEVLANRLIDVLNAHGYGASSSPHYGSIIILPIKETNAIIAFSADEQVLAYVRQWAVQLDQMNPQTDQPSKPGLYLYPVKNTTAQLVAEVLNKLWESIKPSPTEKDNNQAKPTKLVVDPHRNALLFTGTGEEWARLLPILNDMDKPPKQVLVEVTIAEIALTDADEHGIEWMINNAGIGGLDGTLGTVGGLGIGSGGLTYTLKSADQVRSVIRAFASSSRATILSTPRLMVRSGSNASIDIGSEIPTLTSQSTTNQIQGGDTALLQQIQYRRTGILLNIEPIVYAGRRIDLKIDQQVSEARSNTTSNISSPAIFNRRIKTELSLSDGEPVLLGGLISENRDEGWSGVPVLSEIPILGQLFRVNRTTIDRTELIVIIIPYVIDDESEAKAITEAIKQRLEILPFLGAKPLQTDNESLEK